jgi:hypothetical protein
MNRNFLALYGLLLSLFLPTMTLAQQTLLFAVNLPTLPHAAFGYNRQGLTVDFQDASGGNPISWNWTFGDGSTSSLAQPTHTYATAGTYVVCLTVENAAGCTDQICDTLGNVVGTAAALSGIGLSIVPNPFAGSSKITFSSSTDYTLRLSDLQGRQLLVLSADQGFAGTRTVTFVPAQYGFGAGIYCLSLQVGTAQVTRRMVCVE